MQLNVSISEDEAKQKVQNGIYICTYHYIDGTFCGNENVLNDDHIFLNKWRCHKHIFKQQKLIGNSYNNNIVYAKYFKDIKFGSLVKVNKTFYEIKTDLEKGLYVCTYTDDDINFCGSSKNIKIFNKKDLNCYRCVIHNHRESNKCNLFTNVKFGISNPNLVILTSNLEIVHVKDEHIQSKLSETELIQKLKDGIYTCNYYNICDGTFCGDENVININETDIIKWRCKFHYTGYNSYNLDLQRAISNYNDNKLYNEKNNVTSEVTVIPMSKKEESKVTCENIITPENRLTLDAAKLSKEIETKLTNFQFGCNYKVSKTFNEVKEILENGIPVCTYTNGDKVCGSNKSLQLFDASNLNSCRCRIHLNNISPSKINNIFANIKFGILVVKNNNYEIKILNLENKNNIVIKDENTTFVENENKSLFNICFYINRIKIVVSF